MAPESKIYDTINECVYCGKIIRQKMKRHLVTVHQVRQEVAAALAESAKEQIRDFAYLMNKGNFQHNKRVLSKAKENFS